MAYNSQELNPAIEENCRIPSIAYTSTMTVSRVPEKESQQAGFLVNHVSRVYVELHRLLHQVLEISSRVYVH